MSTINRTAHGLTAGQRVAFDSIVPTNTGIDEDIVYYVLAAGLTADAFQISETDGGTPLTLAFNITSGLMQVVPETTDSDTYGTAYVPIDEPTDVHAPPTIPATPSSPSVASVIVSGLVRLHIVLSAYVDDAVRIRAHEVQVTHKYTDETVQGGTTTGVASTDVITKTGHGFVGGETIRFKETTGGSGITIDQNYFVLAAGITTDTFQFSLTAGGAAVDFTTDLTAATIALIGTPQPDWLNAQALTLPQGTNDISIPCAPSTAYAVRARVQDVYGNFSLWSNIVELTTGAGSDALAAALADLSNDVQDNVITATKISDNAIETRHIKANSITANALATTLLLASLIKTADTGRRIEIDVDGIRLFDTDESLLVRIPTNGDPVYVKGEVNANSLISQTAASFRTAVSIDGNTTLTAQNGISAPSVVPSLTASVDYKTLTSTPGSVAASAGIAYDSGAGTFWIACDPTVSPFYVAQEFNASTGALVRSISATGSTATYTTTQGSTSHISDTAQARDSSTESNIATPITMPSDKANMQITKVSAYVSGYGADETLRNCVWSEVTGTGNLMRETSSYTAAGRSFSVGNSVQQNKTLTSPVGVSAGQTIYAGWRRTSNGPGFFWDRDDGSGKTTKAGTGYTADGTDWVTWLSSSKPNVYVTFTYDVDTRLETASNIGIATDGTYIYTLDKNGVVWKYLRSDGSYVAKSAVLTDITGTKANAGLFYDATAAKLMIVTAAGVTGTDKIKWVVVDPTALTVDSTATDDTGATVNGSTAILRGGARVADPLNSNAATYWVVVNGTVKAFAQSTGDYVSNRDFGVAATVTDGITHDGTQFRGYDSGSPTTVWKFSNWDWTTASALYWVGYAWYDSNATGGTHETACGPRASITMRRRERLQVQNAAIPTGGTDDPDKVRIYMKPNATDPSAGSFWLQVTDALTSRILTDYTGSGTADGSGTAFPAGTPAELKSAATGWSLKGDGSVAFRSISMPAPRAVVSSSVAASSTAMTVPQALQSSFLIVQTSTAGSTNVSSIVQTNVTWTKIRNYGASTARMEVWKGVPSGTPGTTCTVTWSGSSSQVATYSEWPASAGLTGTLDLAAENGGTDTAASTGIIVGGAVTALTLVTIGCANGTIKWGSLPGPFNTLGFADFALHGYAWMGGQASNCRIGDITSSVFAGMMITLT